MNRAIVIFGTGAHARKVYHCAVASGWTVTAFLDEAPQAVSPIAGIECRVGAADVLAAAWKEPVFVAIGHAPTRRRILGILRDHGMELPALVHPGAWVAPDAALAEGVFVGALAVVETGARIATGVIVDIGALVDHDAMVGEFVHLRPGVRVAAGEVVAALPADLTT